MTAAPFGYAPSDQARAFLAKPHPLLIDGAWVQATGERVIEVENPATGAPIAQVQAASLADLDAAVAAARRAFDGPWSRMTAKDRARILFRFADALERDAARLAEIEVLENGMPIALAQPTIAGFCADFIRYYAGAATKIEGATIPASGVIGRGEAEMVVYTQREPVGVVGAIIPWNAPASMLALKIGPALAAGCTMVLKPAELTPLLAESFAALLLEAGCPPGVFNLVHGYGEDIGAALAAHPGVDKVAFTGSTEVGKAIVRTAATDLKRVTLELGGKGPFVVFPDADMAQAIPAAGLACFFLSGQNCMAGTRLFLHEGIATDFLQGLAAFTSQLKVGDGLDPETLIGPLISARQRERVMGYVTGAKQAGARLVCGGDAPNRSGYFVSPTIFADVSPDMAIAREEIFGPVLSVQTFQDGDLDGLAKRINDTPYGLSGSVWTQNVSTALAMAKRIRCGQVSVNVHAAVSPETPFGGFKQSGWGREFGMEGLNAYLETKAISVNLGVVGAPGG